MALGGGAGGPRGQGRERGTAGLVRRDGVTAAGLGVLLTLALLATLAPTVAPYDPLAMGSEPGLAAPDRKHPFGTDLFGRDILSRTIYAGRVSLGVAAAAVLLSGTVGVALGLAAGYYGGWLDLLVMRAMDLLLAFPGIFLALCVVALLGPGLANAALAVAISAVPTYARTVRGVVLSARENLYVEAARVAGCGDRQIMLRHLLPNVFAPLIILLTTGVAWAILSLSTLSFLGLGPQPPTPEWGAMLYEGRGYLRQAWWATTFPGLAIMVTVLAVNRLGDGLRDALDPHTARDWAIGR